MIAAIGPGTTFGAYRVEGVVGRGEMGVVYRATDLSLARPVALKLIAPELAGDERFRARFLREPRLAASLDHPSVVPIYEAGERDGQLYLVMRFVEGDLKTVLEREGTLPRARAHDPDPDSGRPRCGPPTRSRPQGRQARERAARRGRARLSERLRDQQATRLNDRRHRRQHRHARLPGPRADPRRASGWPLRLLRAHLRPVRVPRRHAPVPAADTG